MQVNPLPSKRALLAAALILLVMLAVGSFADYSISLALYHPDNPFGKLLAGFGEYPAALGFSAAGAMLLSAHNRQRRLAGMLQMIAGAGSFSPAGPWRRRSPPGIWIFLSGWRPSSAWAARG